MWLWWQCCNDTCWFVSRTNPKLLNRPSKRGFFMFIDLYFKTLTTCFCDEVVIMSALYAGCPASSPEKTNLVLSDVEPEPCPLASRGFMVLVPFHTAGLPASRWGFNQWYLSGFLQYYWRSLLQLQTRFISCNFVTIRSTITDSSKSFYCEAARAGTEHDSWNSWRRTRWTIRLGAT